jgi:PAS domain S-box-containing protein
MFDFFAASTERKPRQSYWNFSVLVGVTGISYFAGSQLLWFMHPELFAANAVPYFILAICLYLAIGVWINEKVKKLTNTFVMLILLVSASHLIFLNYINKLNIPTLLVLCLVMVYSSFFLTKLNEMLAYFGYILIGMLVVVLNVKVPLVSAMQAYLLVLSIAAANFLFLKVRSNYLEYLRSHSAIQNSIFDDSYDAILLIDLQKEEIIECNLKAQVMLGEEDKSKVLGKSLIEFIDRDFYEINLEQIFSDVINKGSFTGEFQFSNLKGERYWGDFGSKMIKAEDRSCIYLRIADITRQKHAEQQREIEEVKYRTLMEEALDGIFLADLNGNVLDANQRTLEMFGYPRSEFIGLDLKKIIDPDDLNKKPLYLSALIEKGGLSFERMFIRKDHTRFIVEMNAKIIEGKFIYGIIRDITARKELEQLILNSERKFRSLINKSYDIVAVLDRNYTVKFISESVERNLGINPSQIVGHSIFEFVSTEYQQVLNEAVQRKTRMGGSQDQNFIKEIKIKHLNGEAIYFDAAITNMLYDELVEGIVVNLHNITQRRHTEDALRKVNFELDNFVYKASHDLRAPLLSILGLLNLSKMDKEGNASQYLDLIEKSVLKLDKFLHDLIHYSRNDRRELEFTEINFNEIVEEAQNNIRFINQNSNFNFRLHLLNELKQPFYSDQMRMSIILNNLISNAYKYANPKSQQPEVFVRIRSSEQGIQITVSDNGIGINEKYLDKIFNMFFRASDQSTGSGLGLYLVKNAVEKLSGQIEVQSELNRGTEFNIFLPKVLQHENSTSFS